ncbi:glucan 1,4-alpha-glucosidase [Micromonospora sp. NPDC048930]|uniref:glucan 1,4-alpha-glucosidase n=1 Tax=Micromonospora sp. NPDC048930 TaxID=3364261 RepID=UPI0037126C6C
MSILSATAMLAALATTDVAAAGADPGPPGAPGASATWTTGDKDGIGTALSRDSKLWYTLAGGTLSEVYYPAADTPNVRELQFAVTDGATFSQRETDGTRRVVELADRTSLTYRQITSDEAGRWRLTKTYVTDPVRSALLIDVAFETLSGGPYQLHVLYDPALAGNARDDSGESADSAYGRALVASDSHDPKRPTASALLASTGFTAVSTGYAGTSDGWQDLSGDHRMDWTYAAAGPGNVVQTGQLATRGSRTNLTLALGFGTTTAEAMDTASASLDRPFTEVSGDYQAGWRNWLGGLKPAPRQLTEALRTQYNVALMAVKAHEDKTHPGAFIASLTLPWGQAVNADNGGGGYHFVWARDLYHQVTALLAAGDTASANAAVTWLFTRQQEADGHFPQTSHVDGTPDQRGIQLDETAFPLVLAWQVGRTDRAFYRDHIRPAADYLVAHGPVSPQERWEETGGYSPSTIAAEIAGLTAAAAIARDNDDLAAAAVYQGTADSWQRRTEEWMYTTTGPVGDGRYYVRINANGRPDDGAERDYANGAGTHRENSVLDAGFLELVRLGVKAPDDAYVAGSLAETDTIAQDTPSGRMWHRYTYDGYGEKADGSPWDGTGVGRLWPLLSGERGEYVLANGGDPMPYLRTMQAAANPGYLIPEQVWDRPEPTSFGHVFGKGTGSAAPLAWAMAQYVRLAQSLAHGSPVETPKVVAQRYATGTPPQSPELIVTSPTDVTTVDGRSVRVTGTTSGSEVFVDVNGVRQAVELSPVSPGRKSFDVEVQLPAIRSKVTVAAVAAGGGTNTATRTVLSFGQRIGGLTDPAGDDNGPGDYTYPTAAVFRPGTFDLTGVDVYAEGEDVLFVTKIAGEVTNPWGGDQISLQRINLYLGAGDGAAVPALPGTNMDTASPWSAAVVVDGRYGSAGVFAPDGSRVSGVRLLTVAETRQIAAIVPRAALGTVDPARARYGIAMFGNAEPGEGTGFVRPVYDGDYWNAGDPWWIKQYRFGGGAGVWTDTPSHDSDTTDPNAIDVIVADGQSQAQVMDWRQASPVALPMQPLTR